MDFIRQLKERVLEGGEISFQEALTLAQITEPSGIQDLCRAAHEITRKFHSEEPSLCSLVNAKSNLCSEDCAFCSQSVRHDTRINQYPLMKPEEVLTAAKRFEEKGVKSFCVVTSGGELTDNEFESVLEMFRMLREQTQLNLDGSLGFLTAQRAVRLKEAGVRRINNNLQTSREFYPEIVSTHTYDKRKETLDVLRDQAVEICSGGIWGMGESAEDRIRLAFELKPYQPQCLPVNLLNPRPGTPLENAEKCDPMEFIKMIAVYRFIHPHAGIKLAGGRELNLGDDYQRMALQGGANGMIIGGYLTTAGNPAQKDFELLRQAGYQPKTKAASAAS
ncbi:biotin synthase BioB [Omnitrophica bacterium]|nr:biotin synthase BioB [Candidatus Omnitrophota bacterium]